MSKLLDDVWWLARAMSRCRSTKPPSTCMRNGAERKRERERRRERDREREREIERERDRERDRESERERGIYIDIDRLMDRKKTG